MVNYYGHGGHGGHGAHKAVKWFLHISNALAEGGGGAILVASKKQVQCSETLKTSELRCKCCSFG